MFKSRKAIRLECWNWTQDKVVWWRGNPHINVLVQNGHLAWMLKLNPTSYLCVVLHFLIFDYIRDFLSFFLFIFAPLLKYPTINKNYLYICRNLHKYCRFDWWFLDVWKHISRKSWKTVRYVIEKWSPQRWTRQFSSRMRTARLQTVRASVATTRWQYWWEKGVGPQIWYLGEGYRTYPMITYWETDTCKITTLPQLRWRTVKSWKNTYDMW